MLSVNYTYTDREKTRNSATIIIGTFLEYFDLYLFVHLGILLQKHFFPSTDFANSYLGAFAGWCLSYLGRPLGSLLFGWLGDMYGRKNTFVITTILMGLSSIFMSILPSYEEIGISSTTIFILLRITQTMSAGGEYPGGIVYLSETNTEENKPYIISLVDIAINLGGVAALLVGYMCLLSNIPWIWKVPFALGGLVSVVGACARLSLKETPVFLAHKGNMTTFKNSIFAIFPEFKFKETFILLCFLIVPGEMFFLYGMGAVTLKELGCSDLEVVKYNLILAVVMLVCSIVISQLTKLFNAFKLVKCKAVIACLTFPFIFYRYNYFTTIEEFVLLQSSFIIFMAYTSPCLFKVIPFFKTQYRYFGFAGLWTFARILANLIFPFLHFKLQATIGYWGNFSIFFIEFFILYFIVNFLSKDTKNIWQ